MFSFGEIPMPAGAHLLSQYPARKVRVGCGRCGMSAKYDRDELIAVGGDRPLPLLLNQVAKRKGCPRAGKVGEYDRCGAVFPELPRLLRDRDEASQI
jgi:hypothetical protein